MSLLKKSIKERLEKYDRYRYHYYSNKIATKSLNSLVQEKGKFPSVLKKRADEYAVEILGSKKFAPWLYVYSHFTGDFKEGWIPDNFYGKVVIQKIQGDYGKVSFLKPLTNRLFQHEISPDLGYYINGVWFDSNYKTIQKENIGKLLFSQTDKIIYKLDQSFQGKGIHVFHKKDFNPTLIAKLGNGVIQRFIQQHEFFNAFTPDSVATIRLTTVIDNDAKISLRAAYLRLGRNKNKYVTTNEHIRIPIDMKNGTLDALGYLPNWHQILHHPDTQEQFEAKQIPNFKACKDLVLNLHQNMPMVRAIGWDLCVDAQNTPIVMEWNGYSNDIKFSEASQGPCFKDLAWGKLRI
ncbi:hypothetical protein Celal_1142 [Cellulophaga algicola DSM 14237]|uniref:Alpha-L-glutamate ligase-related protein ATP-grasp domain-containing protein n=1 Tax=Cellulophaga algicola (strain DSM 14237 / IC166 / ACAM 630) TaxID=688270 RepID=E6X6F3_CELAD|nr:sugar-transfer associated ATP-grasp domain-containing protein [Cellulophaga algicola]ADV48459.1 hypothetical protein Celal_1142 [Cellulophaga algicola DSM 14237]